jgi:1,4-dihydroxy-2-naphthoate octaprenyltransferase
VLCAPALPPAHRASAALAVALFTVLALGYTVPPLKLAHRGAGELDVALTHSAGVVVAGYLLQGGAPTDPLPWLLALPLGVAVLPAILLAGVPDFAADRAAGKRTLVVRVGRRGALTLAMVATVAAARRALAWSVAAGFADFGESYRLVPIFALPHAALLVQLLAKRRHDGHRLARIDGLIALALSYILWFAIVPLWHLSG